MYELAVYIIPSLQQGSNVVHRPYFTHGPNKQRPFLLIEVHITDGRTLYVLLSQVFWQEDRETLLDDFDAVNWPYEWSQYMKAANQPSVGSISEHS
jgi:hypothetical protein